MRMLFLLIFILFNISCASAEIDLSSYNIFSNLKTDTSFDFTLSQTQRPVFLLGDSPVVYIKTVSRDSKLESEKFSLSLFEVGNPKNLLTGDNEIQVSKKKDIPSTYNNTHCDESASEFEKYFSKPIKWLEFNFRVF